MSLAGEIHEAAAALGIASTGGGASGLVDGRPVSFKIDWTKREGTLVVHGHLAPRLDLGLEMHRLELTLLGANEVVTGSDDLDTEFSIRGDEPSRSAELFTAALRDHLAALHRAPYDFGVDDGGCAITDRQGVGSDAAWIVRAARAASRTVSLLDEARAGVRPAAVLAGHAGVLRAVAAARGLAFASTPLSIAGRIEGCPVAIGSARTWGGRHHLDARAGFETELGVRLTVRRDKLLDDLRTMFGGQDINVGEKEFDRRFLVRADPAQEGRVRMLLDREVCMALLALDERAGAVTIDDRGVVIDPIAAKVAPETLVWALDALHEVRLRIEHNHLHGSEGGPYR